MMTDREYRRLLREHVNRDRELCGDQLLQRAILSGFARRHGRSFLYLYATGVHQ